MVYFPIFASFIILVIYCAVLKDFFRNMCKISFKTAIQNMEIKRRYPLSILTVFQVKQLKIEV